MQQLWHDILTHRLVATLFVLCWVGSWVITVVMWNQTGAVGLPILQQLLFAVVASITVGWWRMRATTHWNQAHIVDSMRHGLVVAVMLMWLSLAAEPILSSLFTPPIEPDPGRTMGWTWQGLIVALLLWALIFGFIASVLGMLGGLVGGTLAYMARHWYDRGGPATPADVS